MMKVLLINPKIRMWLKPTHPPLGLGYIAAVLRENKIDVEILDINAYRYSDDDVKKLLKEKEYDMVGMGGIITVYKEIKWLCDAVKETKPKVPILVGGSLYDVCELVLEKIKADYVVMGEAEYTFLDVAKEISKGKKDFSKIPGLAYRKGKEIIFTEKRKGMQNLDEIPFPAYDLLNMEIYLNNQIDGNFSKYKRSISISSTRGCAYACRFCRKSFKEYGYRWRSVDNVIAEIKMLKKKYNIDFINFNDDLFILQKKRAMEFCEKYKASGLNIEWSALSRVNVVDEELLKAMGDAGCIRVAYGIESGSQKILDEMNKMVKIEQAKTAVSLTRKAGMFANCTFIVGMPGETEETIQETVDFCKELGIPATLFYMNAYPGTSVFEEVKDKLLAKYDLEEYILKLEDATGFVMNFTKMTDEQFIAAKIKAEKDMRSHLYKHPVLLYKSLKDYYHLVGGVTAIAKIVKRKIILTRESEALLKEHNKIAEATA